MVILDLDTSIDSILNQNGWKILLIYLNAAFIKKRAQ